MLGPLFGQADGLDLAERIVGLGHLRVYGHTPPDLDQGNVVVLGLSLLVLVALVDQDFSGPLLLPSSAPVVAGPDIDQA